MVHLSVSHAQENEYTVSAIIFVGFYICRFQGLEASVKVNACQI